jgi:DNA polymerase V
MNKKHIIQRGGKRPGAGRPAGTGKFGSSTKTIRVPEKMVDEIYNYIESDGNKFPLYLTSVSAGIPSPSDDYIDQMISLEDHCVKNSASTFLLKVIGESMINAGIFAGDLMVVDRSIEPRHGKIVIAAVDGELTVKRLHISGKEIMLMAENPKYKPIKIEDRSELHIWGVVTSVIHKF